jgi:hypothetical protein
MAAKWTSPAPLSIMFPSKPFCDSSCIIQSGTATVAEDQVFALFIEPDSTDDYAEFNASIEWGDGTTGPGSMEKIGGGLFEIEASSAHPYTTFPTVPISVSVSQKWIDPLRAQTKTAGQVQAENDFERLDSGISI